MAPNTEIKLTLAVIPDFKTKGLTFGMLSNPHTYICRKEAGDLGKGFPAGTVIMDACGRDKWFVAETPEEIDSILYPDPLCESCGQPTSNPEGLCYRCQCWHHATGDFDMDGAGWH